jgi:hypothetical protein
MEANTGFCTENLKRKDDLKNLDVDGRVWAGFIRLTGGLL